MSEVETPSGAPQPGRAIQPRQAYVEIAELLAVAIARSRASNTTTSASHSLRKNSEVGLGFLAIQRVNTNPSYTQGVQE